MNLLRVCEWGRVEADPHFWTSERREALQEAASAWRAVHRLNALPLEWSGPRGRTLQARQWVGVIEIEGGRVEIYPKTEAALLSKNAPNGIEASHALRALLRLLEAADYGDWVEADRITLDVQELTFLDLWAYLLSKHLWPQLRQGLPSAYLPQEDDLPTVRGRILIGAQLARFGERIDRLVCAWDEFSPDTAMLRLLKCACRFLHARTTHPLALGRLGDCLLALDEVRDVAPEAALRGAERLIWTRATERFRPTFTLARRVLMGQGPQIGEGRETTWAFLVDMNRVFERFCCVALEHRLGVNVEEQGCVGHLLRTPQGMKQLPDLMWSIGDKRWIGDAKWKVLSRPSDLDEDEAFVVEDPGAEALPTSTSTSVTNARASVADVRQLTTYAELQYQSPSRPRSALRAELAILYPSLGQSSGNATSRPTWNGTRLHLIPVRISGWQSPRDALPVSGF